MRSFTELIPCYCFKSKSTNSLQHIVDPHFVQILTAGVNIRWARARVLYYICAQFQFTIIHYMGFTLVKRHITLLQKNNEKYRLVRDFNFNILFRSVSEDLSLSLCFLTLKKQCIFEDGGVLEHIHL